MKQLKRMLAAILAVTMVVGMMPVTIFAEDRTVGLYWSYYEGVEDGETRYDTSFASPSMWDEIGQDIRSVFLFWDGSAFSVVPFTDLKFPDGLTYTQLDGADAVHMVFDTPMNVTIDYTVDGVTYQFPLEVEDPNADLPDGLYWCWGSTLNVLEAEISESVMPAGSTYSISLFLKQNGEYIQLDGDSAVTASDELVLRWKDKSGSFSLGTPELGSYEIVYGGYTLPVTVKLPDVGVYSSAVPSEDSFLGYILSFADNNTPVYICLSPERINGNYTIGKLSGLPACLTAEKVENDTALAVTMNGNTLDCDEFELGVQLLRDGKDCGTAWETFAVEKAQTVGLYWAQYRNGGYDTSDTADFMYDIVGQDIRAMFLFWDGAEFAEVPYEFLVFPDGLTYSRVDNTNAVYMIFDKALDVTIDYTVGDVIYRFPLEVDDFTTDLPDGLYACAADVDENDKIVPITTMLCNPDTARTPLNGTAYRAFYLVRNGEMEQLMLADLTCDDPDRLQISILERNDVSEDGIFEVQFLAYGSTSVSCERDGVTYTLPMEVKLDSVALFDKPVRSEATYAGETILFDGKPSAGETLYMIVEEGWNITNIRFEDGQPDFFDFTIVDGHAVITITEGFEDARWYSCTVDAESIDDPNTTNNWWFGFSVEDARPSLKWCEVDDPDGVLTPQTGAIQSRLERNDHLGNSVWAAFYFVDGDEMIQLMKSDLRWDSLVDLEILEEEATETEKDGFFRVRFKDFGSGVISYTHTDGETYELPVTIDLPSAAYYIKPERTAANYAGQELVFDGKDENGKPVTEETFYLMLEDGWKVTGIDLHTYGMESFYKYDEIETAQDYVVIAIKEGFDTDQRYEVLVHGKNEFNDKNEWWADFDVKDARPGLRWCEVDEEDGVYTARTNELQSTLIRAFDQGNGSRFAVCYFDGETATLLDFDELTFSGVITAEIRDEDSGQDWHLVKRYTGIGSGAITYTLGNVAYTLPVEITLPKAAYYTAPERTVVNYAGQELVFDGKDEDGNPVTTETFYLLLEDGWKVTDIELHTGNMDFYTWDIPKGENYAVITIGADFEERGYEVLVYVENINNPQNTNDWWADFSIQDARPGLRWCGVDDPNDIFIAETDEMNAQMDGSKDGGIWAAIYFVDGDEMTQLMLEDLSWDADMLWLEKLERNGTQYNGFFQINFLEFGETAICYGDYTLPVTIGLPWLGLYNQPVASKETYIGDQIVLDGDPAEGETVYLLFDDDRIITDVTADNEDVTAEVDEYGRYAAITVTADFKGEALRLDISYRWPDNPEVYETEYAVGVQDKRPGLRWCWDGSIEDVENGNYNELQSFVNVSINERTLSYDTYGMAFWFVDGDTVTKLGKDADLDFGNTITANWDTGNGCFEVKFPAFGVYDIVYTDEDGTEYALPVTVTLPQFGFYSEPEASEEAYLGAEFLFRGDPTTVYLVCDADWLTITDLELDTQDGEDMSFLDWEISKDGRYITLEISKEVRADSQYAFEVCYITDDGEKDSTWASFTVLKKDPGLIWNPVKEDGQGGYIVTDLNVHRDVMTLAPGDSFLLQVRYFDGANYTVLDLADLNLPGFVTVETVDAENAILCITCNGLGIGTIACDAWEGSTIRITAQAADVLDFYTQPERDSAYLDRNFNGVDGETITRYLMWDQTLLPDVDKVTVSLNDGMNGNCVVVDQDVTTTDLSRWGIVLTADLANGFVKVEATLSVWRNVKFTLWQGSDIAAETAINIDEDYSEWGDDREDSRNLVFDWYDGTGMVELTIGMGEVEWINDVPRVGVRDGGYHHFTGDGSMNHQLIVGALANAGTDAESEAPKAVYDAISDVRFFVSRWMNTDGSGDQMESNITVGDVYTIEVNGKSLYAADLKADAGDYAYIEVGLTFTVTLDGISRDCTVYHRFGTEADTRIMVDMSSLDTAAKLNAVLASTEALEAWLQENDPEALENFYTALNRGDFTNMTLYLPPVQYDGIIEYGITGLEGPDLEGTEDEDGNRTTMPGLWLRGNDSFFLSDIDFVADDRYKMTMDGETFTCGLLSHGVGTGDADIGDIFNADNCTFTGFDYGVWCTPTGYTIIRNSIFIDCGVGYLIDCEGKDHGNANSIVDNNRFVYCGVGLWVKGLPEYITPYVFRVINNDFLSCEVDIDASQPGRLYFFRNYFGKVHGENNHEIPTEAADVHKHAPKVRGRGLATIVASPRWRDPVTFELDRDDNHLIVDNKHGLVTYIPADEAADLLMNAAAMAAELDEATNPVSIGIVEPGDEGDTLGTWTFPVMQTFSLFGNADDDFCAALDISWENDVQYITVQDSSLLSRMPTLTIPCGWIDAKVTFNGEPVESTLAGGKLTFTVAAGGTYAIEEVAVAEDNFVTGNNDLTDEEAVITWYDRSEGEVEEPDFLQVGSETTLVEKEMDADVEGEEYDENAVTETTLVTVEASFKAPVDETVVILLVLYDENGRMLAMAQQEATQNSGTGTIVVKCDQNLIKTDAVMVKAFVINADGTMAPLSAVPFSQTLELTTSNN